MAYEFYPVYVCLETEIIKPLSELNITSSIANNKNITIGINNIIGGAKALSMWISKVNNFVIG